MLQALHAIVDIIGTIVLCMISVILAMLVVGFIYICIDEIRRRLPMKKVIYAHRLLNSLITKIAKGVTITMNIIDRNAKWVCLVLIVWITGHGIYHWESTKYDTAVEINKNLAVSLSQLNNLIGLDQAQLIQQVNAVLTNNGHPELVRKIEVKKPVTAPEPVPGLNEKPEQSNDE